MTKNIRLLIVAGARPNFMKVAPIIHQIRDRSKVNALSTQSLVVTAATTSG